MPIYIFYCGSYSCHIFMSLFFNTAHQPARCETPVCGEDLPIQVFKVVGGVTAAITSRFPEAVCF